ncbi:MAG: hypothetical protein ACI3ZY_00060 [Parabacteroides sp.]
MNKSRFVEEVLGLLNEYQTTSAEFQGDKTALQAHQFHTLDQLIDSYKQCQKDSINTDDECFSAWEACLKPVLDLQPSEDGYSKVDTAKRLYAFERIQQEAEPWMCSTEVEIQEPCLEDQLDVKEPEPVQEAQHQRPKQEVSPEQEKVEPEALFVAAPAGLDIDNLKFKQADAKPGFFQRWLYRWKVQYDNPSTDKMIGLDGSKMRQEMEKKAYAMGFSEEECQQIGKEFAQKYLEDYYLDKSREKEDYFLFSKTFREKQLGADYLAKKGLYLSDQQLQKLDVADQLRNDLTQTFSIYSNPSKREGAAFKLFWDNMGQSFMNPLDGDRAVDAMKTAMRLGFSDTQAKIIANEVYTLSDKDGVIQSSVRSLSGGDSLTIDDFLRNSPTFMADERGQKYLMLQGASQEVDGILGFSQKKEGLDIGVPQPNAQMGMNNTHTMTAGIGVEQLLGNSTQQPMGYSTFNQPATTGVTQQQEVATEQQRKTGIGGFFSSTIGMVLMMLAFFFIAKKAGLSGLWAGVVAGGGGLLLPQLGNLLSGAFSQGATGGVAAAPSVLQQAEQHYAMQQRQGQQIEMANQRNIQDGMAEQTTLHYNDQELMGVVKEQGFAGLRTYLGNNEQLFNTFVTQHNLTELAKSEAAIRLNNGDWLKATQSALNSRDNLAMAEGKSVNNGLKMNV